MDIEEVVGRHIKRKRAIRSNQFLPLLISALLLVALFLAAQGGISGFAIYQFNSEGNFSGTYQNTFFSPGSEGIEVNTSIGLQGNYTSQILDAGKVASWNSILWSSSGTGNIVIFSRSCGSSDCNGVSWTQLSSPGNLSLQNQRYFQFKAEMSAADNSSSPSLSNIRIDYTLTNSNPYIQILGPENASLQTSNSVILQFKIFDAELDKINVSIYGDGNLIYSANELDNNTLVSYNWTSLSSGSHIWIVNASDWLSSTLETRTFSVQENPSVTITSPANNSIQQLRYNQEKINLEYNTGSSSVLSCSYTNLTGSNVSLSGCSNAEVKIPSHNDRNYSIIVYTYYSSGLNSTAASFFTADYSSGNMNGLNVTASNLSEDTFKVSSFATCESDWCENVSARIEIQSNCNLSSGYQANYSKGDFNSGQKASQDWKIKCNGAGEHPVAVFYSWQNGSINESKILTIASQASTAPAAAEAAPAAQPSAEAAPAASSQITPEQEQLKQSLLLELEETQNILNNLSFYKLEDDEKSLVESLSRHITRIRTLLESNQITIEEAERELGAIKDAISPLTGKAISFGGLSDVNWYIIISALAIFITLFLIVRRKKYGFWNFLDKTKSIFKIKIGERKEPMGKQQFHNYNLNRGNEERGRDFKFTSFIDKSRGRNIEKKDVSENYKKLGEDKDDYIDLTK